ncbi:MAG: CPBP family glutamic-type intramembrane protease [Pseudomonadota bacterium]
MAEIARGSGMPLAFSFLLFAVAGIAYFVRHGGVDLSPLAAATAVSAALCIAALGLIGREIPTLFKQPDRGRGDAYPRWSWGQTLRLSVFVPLVIALPTFCAATVVTIQPIAPTLLSVFVALSVQIVLFAIPQELFFREAALRAFGRNLTLAFVMSCLATALFHLPLGFAGAALAAASGAVAMALRVAGMNIFVIAALQGTATVIFGRLLVAQTDAVNLWYYTTAFTLGCGFCMVIILLNHRGAEAGAYREELIGPAR